MPPASPSSPGPVGPADPVAPADPVGPTDDVPCVGAVVLDPAGALLLVQRRHDPGAGRWSLPGGHVEPGEDDPTAVAREVAEETGLAVRVGRLVGRVRRPAGDGRVYDIRDHVAVPLVGGTAPALTAGDDAADARWVSPAAYASMTGRDELVRGLTDALDGFGVTGVRDAGAAGFTLGR